MDRDLPAEAEALELLREMAAMHLDGEIVDGVPYEMSIDDALETMHLLVRRARAILGVPAPEIAP